MQPGNNYHWQNRNSIILEPDNNNNNKNIRKANYLN